MNKVITWKTGRNTAQHGYVGAVKMFFYQLAIAPSVTEDRWVLNTLLPGFQDRQRFASPQACEAAAETMLRTHLNSLLAAGVELPKVEHIDAALDGELLEATAQAIARVTLRGEFACDDEMWASIWKGLSAPARLGYRLKAQAALKA